MKKKIIISVISLAVLIALAAVLLLTNAFGIMDTVKDNALIKRAQKECASYIDASEEGTLFVYTETDGRVILLCDQNAYGVYANLKEAAGDRLGEKSCEYSLANVDGDKISKLVCNGEKQHIHNFTKETVTPHSCTESGEDVMKCNLCDHEERVKVTADHLYKSGVCTVCGYSVLGNNWTEPVFPQGDYSFAVLPDTQNIVTHHTDIYYKLTDYIAENKNTMNIEAVIHLGDMKNNNAHKEWLYTKYGMMTINDAGIPWMPMRGNHDQSPFFNKHFDYAFFGEGQRWFGGSFEQNKLDQVYWYVNAGDRKYLIMSLGTVPTEAALSWAETVVKDHPDHSVILTAHELMNKDGNFLSENAPTFERFSKYENVVLTLSGHISTPNLVTRTDKNGAGNKIYSILANNQDEDTKQRLGMIMFLTFEDESDNVFVNWYSVRYDAFYREKNQFVITVPHVK